MRLDISPRLAVTLLALMALYMADSWHVILADSGLSWPILADNGRAWGNPAVVTRW